MSSPSEELTQRLLAALGALPAGRAARLIDAAWDDAEEQVRETLSTAMRAVLLRQVVAEVERGTSAADRPAPSRRPADAEARKPVADPAPTPEPVEPQQAQAPVPETNAVPVSEVVGAGDAGDEGWYVYGVVGNAGVELPPSLPGIDPQRPVELVAAEGLVALTSRVPIEEFGPDGLPEHLADRSWLEEKVRLHEQVLQHGMAADAIVPMRFCTIVRSSDDLARFLDEHADWLHAALADLAGRQEFGVKVMLDQDRFDAHVEAASDELRRLDEQARERGAGAAYFMDKRRAQLVDEEGERLATTAVREWHARLDAAAGRSAALPLRKTDDAETPQRLVLNGAYLVAADEWEGFERTVAAIAREGHDAGFEVELTGPWPPYSFVATDLAQ